MKRKLSFLTLLLIFCSTMFGQHWTVNENTYNASMNVLAYVEIYGEPQTDVNLEMAAFCGNEVRGVANLKYNQFNDDYVVLMTIYGDTPNEIITFKLYDPSTGTEGTEYATDYTLKYRLNGSVGVDDGPITIDFVEYYWEFVKDNETMPYSMTITSTASIDGNLLNRRNFEVAAFCGDELRGVGRQQDDGIIYFAIWGNGDETENITFKLYDHSDGTLYERTDYSVPFEINNTYGDISNPVNINFTTRPYVAKIGDVKYISLATAFEAALDGETIQLLWAEGDDPIAMNASLYGKNVTVTGTAEVDWSKGFLFVGRGGEGNATLTFDNANLTSSSNQASYGIHVSGREKNTNNKYDGTVEIKNSTIVLDYLINKGTMTLDNSTLTVKNGFSVGGRPASETESGEDATATITLNNGSKVVVNNHNGMGLGYEAIGVMNIDATSTFETTQSFLVTSKGTMNNAGTAKVTGTLTNNGAINLTATTATLEAQENLDKIYSGVTGYEVVYENGVYSLSEKQASAEVAYRAYVHDNESFEGLGVDLVNVYAKESLKVELYSGEQLLTSTTYAKNDYPINADEFTCLIVLDGNADEYWNTEIKALLTVANIPTTIKVYADGTLVNTYENALGAGTNVDETADYMALDCVYKEAKIGTTYYATLQAAIEAAQAGQTVTLLEDITCEETIVIDKDVNIDGDNKTITSSARRAIQLETASKVNIEDLNIKSTAVRVSTNDIRGINLHTTAGGAELTLKNCTVDFTDESASDWAYAVNVTAINNCNLTINGGTYEGANAINVWGNGHTINIDGAVLTSLYKANDKYHGCCVRLEGSGSTLVVAHTTFNGEHAVAVSEKTAGANTVNAPLEEGNTANNTDNTKVYVAKNGSNYYYSINTAIEEAQTGATINLLAYDIDEYVNQECNKSITILGAAEWLGDDYVTTLTGGMKIGIDNSQCDPNTIVVKGITFEGKGLMIASQENVTVENNIFNNITDDRAIAVIGKDIKAVAKNNTITNAAEIGIELRNMAEATITNNVVKNTGHNSVQATAVNADANVTIKGNTFENWGTATNAQGQLEGRAVRVSGGANVVVNNNKMINANAPESFVKITKVSGQTAQTIDVDKNYWNGDNPLALFETDGTNDPVSYIKGYYSDANLTNYIPLTASVAKIGTTYYQTLQAAVDACVVGDNTIEMLAEINEDVTIKQVEGINVVIEGADNTFTGTFYIHGNARHDGAETLTFQNINFTTNEAGHYLIDSNSTASTERYAHNVTVKNCDFTATEAGVNSAAAMRIRQGFNIAINGGTFNDLHSVLQAYGNAGITVDGITVNGKNGISAGTSTGVVVKNTNITATGYGVRADGTGAYDVTIKGTTTINAAMPVVVRKTNDGNGYNLTIADGVTLTTTGSGYQVTFTAGDDGEYVAPTAGATANFGNNSYTTFGLVAKIENEYYTTVDYAAAYATTTEGTQTIVLIDDAAAATNPLNVEVIDLNGKTLTADVLGTVVTNGGLWTTAAAPGYKMLGVGAEIYATAGATVINSQTEVNIVEGDVTLVPAEWWTLQGQSLIIGEHASFTIPTGSKFNVMNNTDVTINGTAINNGTLAIHPEATVNGNVAGNLQFLGGSYVTAEDHKMVGTTDDYHYNTTDALVNIALNGDITIAAGTMTLGHDWRTLPNQTVTVASAAAFIVPSNMTYQIYGTAVVEDGGTLTVNGTIELASLTATLTAEDGLNVTLIDELQNQGYDVDYSNGTYSVIEGMIWNKTQDKKYNSLQAAIDASSEGDEIIVLKDIKYTQDDIITVDVYGYTTMVNATGKNVVLDLNGHLVEADVKDYSGTLLSIIFVGDDGSLTLKDSSVEKTGAVKAIGKEDQANVYALIIADTKNTTNIKLYIESGTYELNKCTNGGALVYVNISNILTVTGGNFYLGNAGTLTNNSPWIFNTHSNGINNVIVKGGNYNVSPIQHYGEVVIPVEFAVTQTSDVTYPYSVVPAVARIDQTGYASIADAVNEANDGDEIVVTVSHTATVPAVVESNLTLNLNGKAITGDVYPVVRVQNGASLTVTGAGSITNNDYVFVLGASDGSSEGDLTIENGMFVGETTVASVTKGLLTINGGEFSISETETYEYAYLINCIDANYNNGSATVSISGGTFHKWNPENNAAEGANTNFCAPGYVAVYDAVNDTYTVIEANYVAQIGEVKYESLQAAINAAQNGDEIDVIDNITLGIDDADQLCDNQYKSFFNVNGKTITIDLNGYTIKAVLGAELAENAVYALVTTEKAGNLTIKDSSVEKTGTMWIDNAVGVYSLVFQYDNSIVTIESGNYKLNVGGNGRGMVYSNDDEKVTVNGGNFWLGNVGTLSNGSPWIFNASGQNTKNIIVNGGTFNDDVLHQFYPFEVMNLKEKALQNNGDGTWTMVDAVAYVDEQHKSGQYYTNYVGFATLEEAFAAAQTYNQDGNYVTTVTMLANVTAIAPIVVVDDVKFNMNTKAVTAQNIYPVIRIQNGASLTVTGAGSITNNDYVFVLGASDGTSVGNLTIENGTFHGATTVASVTKGLLTITGGDFSVEPYEGSYEFLINCIDANYNNGLATVSISGGTFHNWNPENNAAEGANTNFCADGYGAVENPTDVWTVIPKQTMTAEVKKGWNWFSYYVEGDVLDQLQNSLGAAGVQIKSRSQFTQYSNGNWNGDLVSTTPAESYKINVDANAVINVTGNIVNPSECPIMLNNGGTGNGAWNWIGYPLAQETSVATAFAGVVKNGDEVKTRTGFAEYVNGQWWGSLMTLKPGVGYMYFRAGANETVSDFTYPTPSSKEAVQPNITADANLWVPNSTSYANNMTMVAVLNMNGEMMNDNYEVAAMVNGEVRGSARPIYVEPMDAYMLFLTIHGEGVEEVTFQCYDFNTDTEYVLNNTINYSDDARLGSVNEPYVLCYGTMGIGENSIDNINIYPNPTTTDREINLDATCDKVEIYNALGVKVAEYQNVDTLDAIETAGIYVIRVTNDGDVKHCRLVVK